MRIQEYNLENYNLSAKAVMVFQNLLSHMNYRTMECWPSLKKIAAECKLSLSSVQRGIRELLQEGLITKKSRFRDNNSQTSNLYVIVAHAAERIDAAKENLKLLLKQRQDYIAGRKTKAETRKEQVQMPEEPCQEKLRPQRTILQALSMLYASLTRGASLCD